MKKWIFVVIVLLAVASVYLIVPNVISIKGTVSIDKNEHSLYRSMSDFNNWGKWWPGSTKQNDSTLLLNNNKYWLRDRTVNSFFVDISSNGPLVKSAIIIIPLNKDSTRLEWDIQLASSYNPINRVRKFFAGKKLQEDIDLLLSKMRSYYSSTLNTYGVDIKREIVKDSCLISIHDSFPAYPSQENIYSLVNRLREYVASEHAVITDSPMLNIYSKDNKYYYTRVAYPVDRRLASTGKIEYKWMLKGGNILTAEIKGGPKKLDEALAIMETYMEDYSLKAPAIPFYSLVSNRLTKKDSSQWVTKIYYPVMFYN